MGDVRYFYDRFDDKEIIYREFYGDMTAEGIISSFEYLISENKITKQCVGMITDTSNANLKMTIPELGKVIRFLMRNKQIRKLKLAVIVDTPKKIIFPILVAKRLPFIKVSPFSGKESALEWLLK